MKFIFSFLAMVVMLTAAAQLPTLPTGNPNPSSNGYMRYGYVRSDSGWLVPRRDTAWKAVRPAVVYWEHAGVDTAFWYYNMTKWQKINGNAGSVEYVVGGTGILVDSAGRTYTVKADTGRATMQLVTGGTLGKVLDSLAALIPTSFSYVDTIYRKAGQDSIFYTINGGTEMAIKDSLGVTDISGKLNISDTSSMLSPYLRYAYRTPGIDSIYFVTGAGTIIPLKDSTGGASQNFANTNLTFTGAREHTIGMDNNLKLTVGSQTYDWLYKDYGERFIGGNTGDTASGVLQFGGQNGAEVYLYAQRNGEQNTLSVQRHRIVLNTDTVHINQDLALNPVLLLRPLQSDSHPSSWVAGFKYNSADGKMQFKDSAGAWTAFGGGSDSAFNRIESVNDTTAIWVRSDGSADTLVIEGGGSGGSGTVTDSRLVYSAGGVVKDTSTLSYQRSSGAVGIGTASPAITSILDITSTTRGVLMPRLTRAQRDAIVSPEVGLQIFNSDDGWHEYYDSFWGWMPVSITNEWKSKYGIELFSEMCNSSDGVIVANANGAGSFVIQTAQNNSNKYSGILRFSTGNTATGRAGFLSQLSTGNVLNITFGNGSVIYKERVLFGNLSDAAERFAVINGYGSSIGSMNQTAGIYFLYDEGGVSTGSAASANFQLVTVKNSSRTFTTTSVPVAINTWYDLEIRINANATSVEFYINGALAAPAHSTNIPDDATNSVSFLTNIFKSIGTNSRDLYADYVGHKQKFTTAR